MKHEKMVFCDVCTDIFYIQEEEGQETCDECLANEHKVEMKHMHREYERSLL